MLILQLKKYYISCKSAGEYMLLNEMFVHGKNILAPSICVIFNHLVHIGHFEVEVGNYRGITLLQWESCSLAL